MTAFRQIAEVVRRPKNLTLLIIKNTLTQVNNLKKLNKIATEYRVTDPNI